MTAEERILLRFDQNDKYLMEFYPTEYWEPFQQVYDALPWETGDGCLVVLAETYSYLLDILVHARRYRLMNNSLCSDR